MGWVRPARHSGGTGGGRWRLRAFLLAWGTLFAALPGVEAAPLAKKRVLLINSYHPGYRWSDQVATEAQAVLEAADVPVELCMEYMDSKRHPPERIFPYIEAALKAKYTDFPPDVIITSDDNALELMLRRRKDLFPGVPVVFCGINNVDELGLQERRGITGVAEDFDFKGTLAMALRLHPKVRKIALVADSTSTGRTSLARARRIMKDSAPGTQAIELSDLSTAELQEALATLGENTLVFYLHFLRDRLGRTYSLAESIAMIERSCDAPIYTMWEHVLGSETLGGVITSGKTQGRSAARMALRILKGEKADEIPILRECPTQPMFNYVQMNRLGIDPRNLPAGTVFFNKPFSIYQEYKRWIWSVAGVVAVLVVWVVALTFNVTKRRRAEEALRESNERLTSIIESSPVAVLLVDQAGRIRLWSPAAERIFGWGRDEVLGRINPTGPPGRAEGFLADLQGVLAGEHKTAVPSRHLTKAGKWIDVSVSGAPVRDAAGQIVGAVGVIADITEQKRAEAERRKLESQVQHAQKLESLGVLAGGIAHDFNNLLVGILGNADLALADIAPGAPYRRSIQEVRRAAIRASELTNQMLAYSGRGQFVVKVLDLNEIVRETGRLLRVSVAKSVALEYNLGEGLPAVRADVAQISQVVMNLITNASDAIGDAEGTIRLATGTIRANPASLAGAYPHAGLADGHYVYVAVTDSGCGMDEQTKVRLFDPFFTTKFTGRGLGMAAVLGIVRGHRGAIQVTSEPGKGSTFRVLLPACDETPPAGALEKPPPPAEWKGRGTVLVVDDEGAVCKVVGAMLERLGFSVMTALNGRDGVETFRRHAASIAAVLLDMTMPGMGGADAFRELRRIRPDVPVILASGYGEQDIDESIAEGELAGFLHKPFQLDQVSALLRRVVVA